MDILTVMQKVVIASKHDVAELQDQWTTPVSKVNNTYKKLNELVSLKKLVKGDGYFKLPGCESDFKDHAQLLTKALIRILKVNNADIYRERFIPEFSLIPDALIMLRKGNLRRLFILEVVGTERPEYLQGKINLWLTHPEANRILSEITKVKIPHFEIVISGKEAPKDTIGFEQLLEEVSK